MKLIHIIKSFYTKIPHLIFFVTAECNSKCRMCFYWKNISKKQNELTLEEIKQFSEKAGNIIHVTLTGGEPFLRKELSEICNLFYKNNRTKFLTIPTNGLLSEKIYNATKEILENCKKATISIVLSLDGIGTKHDYIRGVKGNFNNLLKTYNCLNELRKEYHNLKIYINTVASSFNKEDINEIVSFVESNLEVDRYTISLIRGDAREPISKNISFDELEKIYSINCKLKEGNLLQRIIGIRSNLIRKMTLEIIKNKKMPIKCVAGKKLLILTESGDLYPCEMLNMKLGNIRDVTYNPIEILKSEKAKEILKFIKTNKCYCTYECAISDSILYSPKMYFLLLKELFKLK